MDHVRLSRLLKLLPIEKIDITREPETGLVIMTARDCYETEFCLGELLVTVAEVKLDTSRGYSMILGDEPRKAVISASVDAVYNSDDNRLKAKLDRYRRCLKRGSSTSWS
jgi:phosphonate C-P lyase system protein PhnG